MVMWTCKTKAPWLCQLKSPECCWHVTNVLWPDRVLLIVCIEVRKQERTRRVQTSAKAAKFIQNTIRPGNLDSCLMPMTHVHVPEKAAWRDHCPIRYQKLIPEKFGTKLHVRRVRNRGTGFSVTAFWRRFLVSVSWALLAIRISQKLARFMFDFSVVNITTDNNCQQQLPRVALRLQQLITPAAKQRSCMVYNSCGLTPNRTGGRSNICRYFAFETQISL